MSKNVFITAAVVLIIAVAALIGYNFFEIYDYKEPVYASPEVTGNSYYAMERWLTESGFKVRTENAFDDLLFSEMTEKVIMVHSRAFFISVKEIGNLIKWIEQGGIFILAIDSYNEELEENILNFLLCYGITHQYVESQAYYDLLNKNESDEEVSEENIKTQLPDFQTRTAFLLNNEEQFFTIKDKADFIRLIEIPAGEGILTVTGTPIFMYNYNLEKEANAVISWKLTGARFSNYQYDKRILFIRPSNNRNQDSLYKNISERGNIIPVIISALLLIITGFWMVIPLFGLVTAEKQRASRPIKDRFNAEINFLKKHRALNYYLHAFEYSENSETEKLYEYCPAERYKDLINHYRRLINGTKKI